ncbi:MAG TPA: hypothetical protein VMF06_22460 [Candidatus Limnocylindria bacterium]|nr:hypothetical protein [Candidatus Limnocylindria bacterium]
MTPTEQMLNDLREHRAVCQEVLSVVERESQALRLPDTSGVFEICQARKQALPRLEDTLAKLRHHRTRWLAMAPAERERYPEVRPLLRDNQDLIMKIIVLDRENEQALLRRGLVPARHLPPAQRQRPHFVADLYRRQNMGGSNPIG